MYALPLPRDVPKVRSTCGGLVNLSSIDAIDTQTELTPIHDAGREVRNCGAALAGSFMTERADRHSSRLYNDGHGLGTGDARACQRHELAVQDLAPLCWADNSLPTFHHPPGRSFRLPRPGGLGGTLRRTRMFSQSLP